jgi:hypothetical protein
MGYGKPPDLATLSVVQDARLREDLRSSQSLEVQLQILAYYLSSNCANIYLSLPNRQIWLEYRKC